jgi:hypothetical protein
MAIAALDKSELADLVAALGLRRRTTAEVVGVVRRCPVRRRVSLRQASRLVQAGAPLEMVHVAAPGAR